MEIAKAYHDFFEQKRNKEFVYYQKFPSVEALDIYAHRSSEFFPLYNHGRLNVAELAEVIRHLYQFHTGRIIRYLPLEQQKEMQNLFMVESPIVLSHI